MNFFQAHIVAQNVPDEAVSAGHARDGVDDDLGALGAQERMDEARLAVVAQAEHGAAEHGEEVRVGYLGRKVAHEDAVVLRVLHVRNGHGLAPGGAARGQWHGGDGRGPVGREYLGRGR